MCGIFAYSGFRNTAEVLISGLKKLEYRGYDSAGIAFFNEGSIHRFRVSGEVSELEKKIKPLSHKGSLGIGHTRWATHGAPLEKNAHPHHFSDIYVVHNGVIENEEEIKKIIGIENLSSDTDTEVIPHLIHHFIKIEKLDFFQSVLKSIQWLKGSYAVVVINKNNPEEMIAFKSGPPLLFCKGKKGEFFVSSDLHAIDSPDGEILFLEDDELLHLKKDHFEIFDFQGKKIAREFKKYSKDNIANRKGLHPHFMIKEILEQSKVFQSLNNLHIDKKQQEIVLNLSKGNQKEFHSLLKSSSQLLILACGSSYHSALFAKYLLEDIGKIRVNVEMASEFIYRKAFLPEDTLVLFISQSGETADILTALKQTELRNLKSISLCNVKDSSLERKTDFVLSLSAGQEVAVASTKTFFASLMLITFFSFYLAKMKNNLDLKQEKDFIKHLLDFSPFLESVLCCESFFLNFMDRLKKFKNFFYLGRGMYYPLALEGALKLKEVAYLHAEAYPFGEMKHGPLAMIDKDTAVLALLPPSGVLYRKSLTNLKEVQSRGACIISIGGPAEDLALKKISDYHLPLPEKSYELLHPLLTLIPLQIMAYYISRSYGYNADKPRNLAKSVTVE